MFNVIEFFKFLVMSNIAGIVTYTQVSAANEEEACAKVMDRLASRVHLTPQDIKEATQEVTEKRSFYKDNFQEGEKAYRITINNQVSIIVEEERYLDEEVRILCLGFDNVESLLVEEIANEEEATIAIKYTYKARVRATTGVVFTRDYEATSIEEAVDLMEEELTYYEVEVKSTSIMRVGRA